MRPPAHGILARAEADGIRLLSENALRPLGIGEGSIVYGVFSQSFGGRLRLIDIGQSDPDERSNPQGMALILSPFHPNAWLSTFRLTAHVKDEPGAIAQALEVMSRLGINILSTDAVFAGYNQTRLSVVCELGDFDRLWATLRGTLQHYGAKSDSTSQLMVAKERVGAMQSSGMRLLASMALVEQAVICSDLELRKKGKPGFLNERLLARGSMPWYISGFDWDSLETYAKRSFDRNITDYPEFVAVEQGEREQLDVEGFPNSEAMVRGMARKLTEAFGNYYKAVLECGDLGEPAGAEYGMPPIDTLLSEARYLEDHVDARDRHRVWGTDLLRRRHMAHWNPAVECRAFVRLAYHAVFGDYKHSPLIFRLDKSDRARPLLKLVEGPDIVHGRSTSLLSLLDTVNGIPDDFKARYAQGNKDDWAAAIIAVGSAEGHARVRFVRRRVAEQLAARIDLTYEITAKDDDSKQEEGLLIRGIAPPVGFLQSLCAAIGDAGGNIEAITNFTFVQESARESGTIRLVVMRRWPTDAKDWESVPRWRQVLERAVRNAENGYKQKYAIMSGERASGRTTGAIFEVNELKVESLASKVKTE